LRIILPVITIISVITSCFLPVQGQEFSDIDTMSIPGAGGYPGDTIYVSVDLVNSIHVAGFQFRITYDSAAFTPLEVNTTGRSANFDLFGANLNEPGVIGFFATSMHPRTNAIPPGAGSVALMTILVRQSALPDSYELVFEDEESDSYDNSLTDTNSTLIIPILDHGQVEVYGQTEIGSVAIRPAGFDLAPNYPNPFNGETVISFTLEQPGHVDLDVYDFTGRKVARLYSGPANSGQNRVVWDGRSSSGKVLASGVFFYRLKTGRGESVTQKMVLLK